VIARLGVSVLLVGLPTAWAKPAPAVQAKSAAPCPAIEVMPGPGVADPFHLPTDAAKQLNADALAFYRQGKWDEARQKYRAAEAADPQFLAPALNVACSFVRQERFTEAMAEVKRLLDTAYLPWSSELATAADLGALKVGVEGKRLRAILDDDRNKWAEGLSEDVLFVARTRAPLKLGNAGAAAAGTFVLGPRQEVFAWSPRTRRYRQLTSEEGRVLLLGRSRDGRRIAFAIGEKLIVTPGEPPRLRGVVIKELDLSTLALLGEARTSGDLGRLEILQAGPSFAYRIDPGAGAGKGTTFTLREGHLEPAPAPRTARTVASLTGKGAAPTTDQALADCRARIKDSRPAGAAPPSVEVHPVDRAPFVISGPFGGGLAGLPIP
jgi:tetratricopeptide (TPR) repeat protein